MSVCLGTKIPLLSYIRSALIIYLKISTKGPNRPLTCYENTCIIQYGTKNEKQNAHSNKIIPQ